MSTILDNLLILPDGSLIPLVSVTGTVAISNLGTSGGGGTLAGSVAVSNFPGTQTVGGTVGVAGTVTVANPISTVSVSNLPGTQAISGTVGVVLPALVAGAASIGNVGIMGTVPVNGTITVGNLPATQTIAGAVTASPNTGTIAGGYTLVTVGTIDSVVLGGVQTTPGTARKYLDISNPSATTALYVNFGAAATVGNAPVVLANGSPRGDVRTWEGAFVPADDVHCVASVATTIWVGHF